MRRQLAGLGTWMAMGPSRWVAAWEGSSVAGEGGKSNAVNQCMGVPRQTERGDTQAARHDHYPLLATEGSDRTLLWTTRGAPLVHTLHLALTGHKLSSKQFHRTNSRPPPD